ncbi:15275_t:CDS:2, partial [Gigaspora margarita]
LFSIQSTASTSASGTSKRLHTFFKLLLHMTISNEWAFQWIENQETIEFFNFISPLLELPSQKTLADEILKNLVESIQNNIEVAAKEDKYGVFVSLDGWKNVVKQNILAIKHISVFLNKTQSKNIKINTVITDSTSSYNAA